MGCLFRLLITRAIIDPRSGPIRSRYNACHVPLFLDFPCILRRFLIFFFFFTVDCLPLYACIARIVLCAGDLFIFFFHFPFGTFTVLISLSAFRLPRRIFLRFVWKHYSFTSPPPLPRVSYTRTLLGKLCRHRHVTHTRSSEKGPRARK